MFDDLSDQARLCYEHAEACVRKAAAQPDPELKHDFLEMARRWLMLARNDERSEQARDFWSEDQQFANGSPEQANELADPAPSPAANNPLLAREAAAVNGYKAGRSFSMRVFQQGSSFRWTLISPAREILGRGVAETELRARTDAFRAGMTYIDRLKAQPEPKDSSSLH
jgi:hypothetical protein